MDKEKGRKSYFEIDNIIVSFIKRLLLFLKSITIFVALHILYGSHIKLHIINSIKGKLKIELSQNGFLEIGDFLMSAGPCYIKCEGNGICKIGNSVFFNHNCSITCIEKIEIGDNCNFANNVVIVDHDHKLGKFGVEKGYTSSSIQIGENVWVGANSVILRGVTIGEGAVIAAGAVVNSDIPSNEIWGGIPARKLKVLN